MAQAGTECLGVREEEMGTFSAGFLTEPMSCRTATNEGRFCYR